MKRSLTLRFLCLLFFAATFNTLAYSQWTWSLSSGGSDYTITASYEFKNECSCNDDYIFSVYKPGSLVPVATRNRNRKDNVSWNPGPSSNVNYRIDMRLNGKNNAVFNCWVGCNFYVENKYWRATTAAIKRPSSASASTDKDYIEVKWGKGTNIPDGSHFYRIARDSPNNTIMTRQGQFRSWKDYDVEPGVQHTYYIYTETTSWGGHKSPARTTTGMARPREARATQDLAKKVTITWDDISSRTDEVVIRRNGTQVTTLNINSDADTSYTDSDPSLIPGYTYDYAVTWTQNDLNLSLNTTGRSQANGRIRGEVKTPLTNLPIENVEVCAILENDIDQSAKGTIYCDTTDDQGQYDIRRIYYYEEASFRVRPFKENHGFDPGAFTNQILDLDNPTLTLDFKDTTSFVVSGNIYQTLNGASCGIGGIQIWVDDTYKGITTDKDGNFFLSVEETGSYVIEPRYPGHTFDPPQQEIFVGTEVTGINYEDTRTNFLEGVVEGGCNIFIGPAQLRAYSVGDNACVDTTFWTDNTGRYFVTIPAREYEIEVIQLTPEDGLDIDPDAVISYFNTESADLTDEGQTRDFIYRRPPSIKITGLPSNNNCSDLAKAIVEQKESYLLDIEVRESFGEKSCPVEEGYVLIFDEVGDKDGDPDTLYLEDGMATYELIPGRPNIVAPHKKLLQIDAHVGQETSVWKEELLVTGVRPRDQTFTTVMPEIPLMILHDPPGDASYSFFEEGFETELGFRIFSQLEGSLKAEAEVKLGMREEIGSIVSIKRENWGIIGGSLEVGARVSTQTELVMTQSTTQQFSTSGNQNITGREGDVYVGAAMNLIYAQADVIEVNKNSCSVDKSVDVIMGNDGFSTTFMYTEEHIKNSLIPSLISIRDFYEGNQSDSATIYDNQINVWQQVLDNNEKSKKKAQQVENRSFSAGAIYSSSTTSTLSGSAAIEVSAFVESSVWKGAGFEVAGSGANGKATAKLRVEIGATAFGSLTKTTTTGFVLNDDDPGDFFSVDIKTDPVYGTPVFDLVSGRSSCPHEAGTQPREDLQLLADSYSQHNVAADGFAPFQLSLGNISQSDEPRTYILKFLQESNPNGAVVTIGGSEAQNPIPYTIGAGQQRLATVTVKRGPRAFDYEGLKFVLTSGCEDDAIADTVSLSVGFQSAYPAITLAKPLENWVVSGSDNDELLIRFLGYDKNLIKKVQLQYAPKDSYAWSAAQDWQSGDLSNATDGTTAKWNVNNIPDGAYDLRIRADYGDGDMYSIVSTGVIDREAPAVFGLPEPRDGEFIAGDIISATFDEALDCFSLNPANISFKSLTTNTVYPVEYGCTDRKIIVRPLWNANQHEDEDVEVVLTGIKDMYGNTADPISWKFTIGNNSNNAVTDTDDDGIQDAQDNCALAANPDQSDLDNDGIGDACDEDIDGDNIPNSQDNCAYFSNPDQADLDQNGIGDVCEQDADGDEDGVANSIDNCPLTPNADQADMDGDGIGDTCDDDIDGDGLVNSEDNCPDRPNPDQANICGATSTNETATLIGIFRLSPNPATTQVQLQMELKESTELGIEIMNLSGQVIWRKPNQQYAHGEHQVSLSVDEFPQGIYVIRWRSTEGVVSRKLVVAK